MSQKYPFIRHLHAKIVKIANIRKGLSRQKREMKIAKKLAV